jgi:hypothetical protein
MPSWVVISPPRAICLKLQAESGCLQRQTSHATPLVEGNTAMAEKHLNIFHAFIKLKLQGMCVQSMVYANVLAV